MREVVGRAREAMREVVGRAREAIQSFDAALAEVEDLARVGREGLDPLTLRARIRAEQDPDGEWQKTWFLRPLTVPKRLHTTHRALTEALGHERDLLLQHEKMIAVVRARHAEAPIGRPERDRLEAQAREAFIRGEELKYNVAQLEQRLTSTPNPLPLASAAQVGLALYLPVVLELLAGSISAQLDGLARTVTNAAADLIAGITGYEEAVTVASQAAGQPLRVPRPSCPARQALEAVARAEVEWIWSAGADPVPEAR